MTAADIARWEDHLRRWPLLEEIMAVNVWMQADDKTRGVLKKLWPGPLARCR